MTNRRHFRLPFIWMADDLISSFYRLEKPLGRGGCRVLRALTKHGFQEALLAVQGRAGICNIAVAGFIRRYARMYVRTYIHT